jgi:hypothetical protein
MATITWGLGNPPNVILNKSDGTMTLSVNTPVFIVHDGTRFPCVVHSIGTELEPKIKVSYLGGLITIEDLNEIQPRLLGVDGRRGGKRRTRGRTKVRTRRRTKRVKRVKRTKRTKRHR